jgi:hypothetical protein
VLSRLGVRCTLPSSVFPLASLLPSTPSAAGSSALFGGFSGSTELSDFPRSCITGVRPSTSRCGLRLPPPQTNGGSPGSRVRCVHACTGSATARGSDAAPHVAATDIAFRFRPQRRHPGEPIAHAMGHALHGSIPGLHFPLSTLRRHSHECQRMTRGRCGWLALHRV